MVLKIVAISDSHDRHEKITITPCDILFHAGDITKFGGRKEIKKFAEWFAKQPAEYKICIAGNHDLSAEKHPEEVSKFFGDLGITYLCDSGTNVRGINIWGTPITPRWGPWAFMKNRDSPSLKSHFDVIPKNTDIIVSHGPPLGYGDYNGRTNVGCEFFLERIKQIQPKLVVCGHIHESYGAFYTDFGTVVVNAAQLNFIHKNINKPVELVWEANHE